MANPPMPDLGSLSKAQLQALLSDYRQTPATLYAKLNPWWIPAPFLQYASIEIAQAVQRGNCGVLMSAPPRHGKSELFTIATPLWVMERFPEKNNVVVTYGEELSTDFTRKIRDTVANNQDLLNVRLRKDVKRVSNFMTEQGGGIKAVGLRGAITGRGADVLVIDDYIKEPKEAMSHDYLEDLWTWYVTVARTRLEPGAVVLIVATRWVPNDIHGKLERFELSKPLNRRFYKVIKIRALAGPGDILGRAPGEALFPARYTADALETIREELGNRWFEAMFQQNPSAEDSAVTNPGNLQKMPLDEWEALQKRMHNQPERFKTLRSWDLASTKEAGDFTTGMLEVYDKETESFYIVGVKRGQWSAGRVELEFIKTSDEDKEAHPRGTILLEQEPGSSGKFTTKHFQDLVPGRIVNAMNTAAEQSKLLKAAAFIAATEKKKVFLVEGPWNKAFIDEFTSFPEGAHDDQIDAASNGYNELSGKKFLGAVFGRSRAAMDAKAAAEVGLRAPDDGATRHKATFGRPRGASLNRTGRSSIFRAIGRQ